ncbi:MAG: leucine-rich repeat domain-containing protein [Oscillospiraceae bacterium]|nr:leucine-rich repeat domain-containing protein [Oscillospiraceae bacterium]
MDKNNQKYTDINGVLFNREKTKLCIYPEGKTDTYYAIPEGTKFIDCNSFSRSLTELVIPEGVTTIKNEFWFAWAATITVPRSVTKIESEILNGKLGIKTDVVIRCYEGSYAHEFAKDKGIKYELI